jgi:hypothetical protein
MTKKIVCLLLAFIMLFSITACSGEDTEKIPDTSTQQGNNSQTPSDTSTPPTTGNEEEVELAPSALYMPIRLSKNDSVDSLMTFGYGAKEIAFTTGSIY